MSISSCDFCGKPQEEVARLIIGSAVAICDECVELAWEILASDDSLSQEPWDDYPHHSAMRFELCAGGCQKE